MDLSLYSGTFGFANDGTTAVLSVAAMAGYPYEPVQFGKRNQGRTDSGARFCFTHWENKHRWHLHFEAETREVTDTLASFFNNSGRFQFNPNVGQSEWRYVWNIDEDWHPRETFMGLFSFDVTIEEV